MSMLINNKKKFFQANQTQFLSLVFHISINISTVHTTASNLNWRCNRIELQAILFFTNRNPKTTHAHEYNYMRHRYVKARYGHSLVWVEKLALRAFVQICTPTYRVGISGSDSIHLIKVVGSTT